MIRVTVKDPILIISNMFVEKRNQLFRIYFVINNNFTLSF